MNWLRNILGLCCASGLILLAAAPSAAQGSPALPTTPLAWSQAAAADVEAAYRTLRENHPGVFNTGDRQFVQRLDEARARALTLAAKVTDFGGFDAALGAFTAELRDGHAGAVAIAAQARGERWPGFVPAWRANGLFVYASDVPQIPVGAQILSCDGRPANSLILDTVFGFGGRPDEAGQWWTQARNAFADFGNPFITLPQRCDLRFANKVLKVDLVWRPVDARYNAWRNASYNGETLPPGLTQPSPKIFWFAMPTFAPDRAEREVYHRDIAMVAMRRAEFLSAKAVVIDLRGNQGGSDLWSQQLAIALWGGAQVNRIEAGDPSRVWWRASPANTRYIDDLVARFRSEGETESADWAERTSAGLHKALATGQPLFEEPVDSPEPLPRSTVPELATLHTPVYVIVPGQCASACLDALDLFTSFKNTRLIGAPSSADSDYLEIRVEATPDGLAKLIIPMKFYRDRPRLAGQIYRPAIEVANLDWSTTTFMQAIMADLQQHQ